MRTFEVLLNGKKLCAAGVGDEGVLTAIVHFVGRRTEAAKRNHSQRSLEDLRLQVGGLISSTREDVVWQYRRLRAGDEVCIRIAEAKQASKPARRERADPAALVAKAEEKYLERAAKKRGWKIVKPQR